MEQLFSGNAQSVCVEACGLGNQHSKGRAGLEDHTCVALWHARAGRSGAPGSSSSARHLTEGTGGGSGRGIWEVGGGYRGGASQLVGIVEIP